MLKLCNFTNIFAVVGVEKEKQEIMITATAILIGKIVLLVLIIGAMVMILLGIGHIFHTDDLNTSEEDLLLRNEIDNREEVVGKKSVFYNFLVKAEKQEEKNKKGPF